MTTTKPPKSPKKPARTPRKRPPADVESVLAQLPPQVLKMLTEQPLPEDATPAEQAQELMFEAWEAPTRKQAIALARKALRISPDCADAYNLLAEATAKTYEDALELYHQGVAAGARELGEARFKEDVGYFWGLIETRPYMRALCGVAGALWNLGRHDEAIEQWREMLRLNPNDNQGIRDHLLPAFLKLGRNAEAEKLYKQYKDDSGAVWAYSRALLDFRKHGDNTISAKSRQAALKTNANVPAYLAGQKPMPKQFPGYYSPGDESEAVLYVETSKKAWQNTPGAIEWLLGK